MSRGLENFLQEKKPGILKKWFHLLLEPYPLEAKRFWATTKDPFKNPVGSTFSKGLDDLFDALLRGESPERMAQLLDPLIRIRAVQGFSPSQAISFVSSIKGIIREELKKEALGHTLFEELGDFDTKVDHLALRAFDLFTECRRQIQELQRRELGSRAIPGGGRNR